MRLEGFGRPVLVPGHRVLPLGVQGGPGLLGHPMLGQGRLSAAPISDEARRALERRIAAIVSAIGAEYQNVVNEYELALSEDAYREVPIIGLVMSRTEVLFQVARDATALGQLADEVARAAGPYLSRTEAERVNEDVRGLEDVRKNAVAAGATAPGAAVAAPAAEHQELHLAAIRSMKEALQRAIVEAEAGSVPVSEPVRIPWVPIAAGGLGLLFLAWLLR